MVPPARGVMKPVLHVELDRDNRVNFDRLIVEQIGLVTPLLHSVHRGLNENGMAADYSQILDHAGFADGGAENDIALHVGHTGHRRGKTLEGSVFFVVADTPGGHTSFPLGGAWAGPR